MTWFFLTCILLALLVTTVYSDNAEKIQSFFHGHTNNWAVLVCASRFWFNYRHIANVLSIYRTVKRFGIPDSQIILMLADDVACNARNIVPATVFNNINQKLNLYGDNVEVDYRGYEVTVENFIRLLTDRWPEEVPRSKRLKTDDKSNILIYMTGHGGDEFLKFQDAEEIGSYDIADAFQQMWEKKRYHEILFMIDTCQANTMFERFYSPNIIATGSSEKGQNSYSHHADDKLGVAVIDRYTYYNLDFLEKLTMASTATLQDLFDSWDPSLMHSNPGVRTDLFSRNPKQVRLMDFFGNVQAVELTSSPYSFPESESLDASIFYNQKQIDEILILSKSIVVAPTEPEVALRVSSKIELNLDETPKNLVGIHTLIVMAVTTAILWTIKISI